MCIPLSVLMLFLWPDWSWVGFVPFLVTVHYLGSALWIMCGELEIDRKRKAKPHCA